MALGLGVMGVAVALYLGGMAYRVLKKIDPK